MNARFIVPIVLVGIALLVVILLALRSQSLHARMSTLESQVAVLKSTGINRVTAGDSPSVPNNAAPIVAVATVNLTPAGYQPDDSHPSAPANVVPIHVVAKPTFLHPGLAYDIYNDGDQPLDLHVTLANPIRMTKVFDCHVMPGKGSFCEIGFDQGFSGSRGDTLTIEALNYLPLVLTQ